MAKTPFKWALIENILVINTKEAQLGNTAALFLLT